MQETHRYLEDIEVEVDPGRIMVNDPRNSVVQVFCGRCLKERGYKEPMIPVDYPLTNILAELNQMGAYTLFSCYGHNMALTAYTEDPYIRFAESFTSELSKILLTFYWERLSLIMGNTFSDKLQSSGRDYLYIEAMDKFLENPLFGAGFGYVGLVEHLHTESGFYQFHSTVFQTLGSMGLAGLAVMIYVYVMRYYTVFCGAKRAKIFFFIAMIGFEGYSLINTSTFTGLPCMTVIYMMLALFELDRAHDKGEIPLGETLKQLLCRRRQVWKKKRA